jgi:Flp pilus assembly protein protease CpaA
MSFILLIPLFIIGIACSYTDIKHGKIKNIFIVAGLLSVAFLYLFLITYSYFGFGHFENLGYFGKLILNGVIALFLGYLLWHFRLWTAADAKLFTIFAFLVPLEFYSNSYVPYFPSFLLLVNIFIPLFLVLMTKALVFGFKEGVKTLKNFKLNKESIGKIKLGVVKTAKVYIVFILIFIILQLFREKSASLFNKIIPDPFLVFLILFLGYRYIFSFFSKQKIISICLALVGAGYAIYLLLDNQTDALLNILRFALIFMVLVGSLRKLLDFYIEKKEILIIKPELLKEGMFPSSNFFNNEMTSKVGVLRAEGLDKKQIEIIKKSINDKKIVVYKTFPFAPFMFIGVAITLLTRSSVLVIIFDFFTSLFK